MGLGAARPAPPGGGERPPEHEPERGQAREREPVAGDPVGRVARVVAAGVARAEERDERVRERDADRQQSRAGLEQQPVAGAAPQRQAEQRAEHAPGAQAEAEAEDDRGGERDEGGPPWGEAGGPRRRRRQRLRRSRAAGGGEGARTAEEQQDEQGDAAGAG